LQSIIDDEESIQQGERRRAIARAKDHAKWFRENPDRQYRVAHVVDYLHPDLVSDWIIHVVERQTLKVTGVEIAEDKFGPVSNSDAYARRRLAHVEYVRASHDQRTEVEAVLREAA
jgi:hypothetical protein